MCMTHDSRRETDTYNTDFDHLHFDRVLMKRDFVSRMEHVQTGPNSHLDTCMNEEAASPRVVTGVVPTTTPPMPKSEQESLL